MRVLIYSRVSTEEQAEQGTSLMVQPRQVQQHVESLGYSVVKTIADVGVSGSVPLERRPGGAVLIGALQDGQAEAVAVVRLDRLFRDVLDGLLFFRDAGAAVISCSEALDSTTPQGRFQLNMLLAAAQYERDLASQRATQNSRGLLAQGRVYGATPYGLTVREGRLYRDPVNWPQRCEIVAMREAGLSYESIRRALRDARVQAPAGGRWWSKSTLRHLCESHPELSHLPFLPEQGGAGQ